MCRHPLKKECFELLACVALLAPCKVIYALLAFLTSFIPSSHFSSKKRAAQIKCGCAFLIAALLLLIKLADILAVTGLSESSGSSLDIRGAEAGVFNSLADFVDARLASSTSYFVQLIYKVIFISRQWLADGCAGSSPRLLLRISMC